MVKALKFAVVLAIVVPCLGCATATKYVRPQPVNAPLPRAELAAPPASSIQKTPSVPTSRYQIPTPPPKPAPEVPQVSLTETLRHEMTEAYQNFQYQEVINLASWLVWQADVTRQQKLEAYVFAGAAAHLQGNPQQARSFFRQALALDPGLQLSTQVFSRSIIEAFEEARNANGFD